MKTAHISLDDETYEMVRSESKSRKVPMSLVIRESLKQRSDLRIEDALSACRAAFGVWKDRDMDVDAHIREIRRDRALC